MPLLRSPTRFIDPPSCSSAFPTSDVRSTPHQHPRPIALSLQITPTSYNYPPSLTWSETARGVWSNGIQSVLSASYPPVQHLLATARRRMSLPVAPSEVIFALAALDVFYNRNDPAHWMFWSDDKKYQTARVVNRIALRSPQVIRSNVAWNGIPEYLFILSGLHGSSSLPVDKEWYGILNPSKAPPPPMSLRKRKPQPTVHIEPLNSPEDDGVLDLEEPRTKRPRRSARPPKPRTPFTQEQATSNISHLPSSQPSPASTVISLPYQDKDALPNVLPHSPSPEPIGSSSDATPPAQAETRPQQQPRLSPTSDLLPALSVSPSPVSATGISPLQETSLLHTRNRSTSQASSSQTVVSESANERRSLSVLSIVTAVEMTAIGGPLDDVTKTGQTGCDRDGIGDKAGGESGIITRGRANKSRTAAAIQVKVANRPTKPRTKAGAAKKHQ